MTLFIFADGICNKKIDFDYIKSIDSGRWNLIMEIKRSQNFYKKRLKKAAQMKRPKKSMKIY